MGSSLSVEETIKEQQIERPNSHFMLVEGMSKLTIHKVETCKSSVFQVSGHKWKLIVHPAGKNGTSDHLSLYLRIKDKKSLGPNGEVRCSVKLFAIDQTEPIQCDSTELPVVCYNAKQAIHGKDCFMTHEELKEKYLKDDKAAFGVEVTVVQSNCAVNALPRTMGTAERLKLTEVPRNKSRFTWKITQFSSFGGELNSSYEFTVEPRRWRLLMCPKRTTTGKGYLSLYLVATDYVTNGPKEKTLAVCKLRLLDQLHRKHYETKYSGWYHYNPDQTKGFLGLDKFLPLEQLKDPSKGYLVNDQIYLGVEFLLVSTTGDL